MTLLTDLADHPPNFWIEPDQAQHLVCGTARAVAQACTMGCAEARIHASSGMIIPLSTGRWHSTAAPSGPGSLGQAVQQGLPIVTVRND